MQYLLAVPLNRPKGAATLLNDNGLGYVAAACKQAGAEVELLSWNVNLDMRKFRERLAALRPDVVGVKVFTTFFPQVYRMLEAVREALPESLTLIGGPHPSASRPDVLFDEFDGLLDLAIVGDGEAGVTELTRQFLDHGGELRSAELSRVPGLVYRNKGRILRNEPFLPDDLDALPRQDWSLQEPASFNPLLLGEGKAPKKLGSSALLADSRGCPAACEHCVAPKINGHRPRKHSLEYLRAEIEKLVRQYGVRFLEFTGNFFCSDVDYLAELCEWLITLKPAPQWGCTGAAYDKNLADRGILDLMRRAGCVVIHFGIESGNEQMSRALRKPLHLDEFAEVVELTASAGIRPEGGFMFGFPGETVKEMNDTIRYALSLPFYSLSFVVCLPLPGTSSYQAVLDREGISRIDWLRYNFERPNLLPCNASISQVHRKLLETRVIRKSRLAMKLYRRLQGLPAASGSRW